MMIWLLGLQAKRDLHSRKKTSSLESNKEDCHSKIAVKRSRRQEFRPISFDGRTSAPDNPQSDYDSVGRPSLFMSPDYNASVCNHVSSCNMSGEFQWGQYSLHKCGESLDSGLPHYKRSLEASKSFPEHSYNEKRQLLRTKGLSYSHALLHQESSDSDDVFGVDVQSSYPRKSSENHWKKLQAAVMGRVRSDSLPHRESISTESGERYSVSSRSVSSDSAIERGEGTPQELSARLSELERELISTKCELAKVLNRQTSFQEILIQKDDAIKHLEEQNTGSSSDSSEGRKKKSQQQKNVKADKEFQEKVRVLQNQNRFLNEEVKKLAKIRLQEHGRFQEQNFNVSTLEGEIEKWKMDYVCLIQSSIRHPGGEGIDDLELCLYGGDKHKRRVQALLEEARKINPRLPTYESLANNEVHVDVYGFKHVYTNTGLLLHYLCTELTHHYLVQAGVYEEHQKRWTMFMRQHGKDMLKSQSELKTLCRGGIPDRFRRQVWRQLVHYKVKEIIKLKGDYYYRNLCNMLPESPLAACYRKQISLDLMRTMPNNVKFSSAGSKGIMDLQDVLLAFCVHNPAVGYCQGMNFIVGMALIFMEAEDAFWALVAIAERYFSPHYFDHSLIGAQADQQILKEMVKEQLPALYEHLEGIDIELSTITLNWFLAVFFDAVPYQETLVSKVNKVYLAEKYVPSAKTDVFFNEETLLRIWDCFLLEGPKVLFRFSLAILKLHEKDILQKTDTMGIMKHLKACAKLSYDVEGIVQLAFHGLKPFPKRRDILAKEASYLAVLKEKHKKKEQQRIVFAEREQLYMNMEAESGTFMGIECAVAVSEGHAWFCYGDQHVGKLCQVCCDYSTMTCSDFTLDSRLMCMCTMAPDRLVLGTISWRLMAVDIVKHEQIWQIQLHDAILSVCCYDDDELLATRIFAGLADGTVAVTEKQNDKKEPNMDVMYIPIGQAPVTCLMLLGEQVWSASGNTVAVIHAKTLDTMDTFSVSVNPYDHILSLVPSEFGIWISLRGSSILELWDPKTLNCRMLYDTRTDRYPQLRKEDDTYFNRARITSTLVNGSRVWVGTGEGNLIIYEIVESAQLKTPTDHSPSVETNSTLSYKTRPERKKGFCGSDMTMTLLCDIKGDSGNISGDSLEVHQDTDDYNLYNYSLDVKPQREYGRRCNPAPKPDSTGENYSRKFRRRSSSENDMAMLQALRYADDGVNSDGKESHEPEDNNYLSVIGHLPKKTCSENDLKKLGEERFSIESENGLDAEEAEFEQEMEAEARRESLTMLIDGGEMDFGSRRQSLQSGGSLEHGSSRRTSLDISPRRKTGQINAQIKFDSNKSDDSGCETQSGPRIMKYNSSSSKRLGQTKMEAVTSSCDTDEDVMEAKMEQRARKQSFVVHEADSNDVIHNNSEENNIKRVIRHNQVKKLMALHQDSSLYSSSSVSLDLEENGINIDGRRLQRDFSNDGMYCLPIIPMDDSYLSSSPGMSITPSPTPHQDVNCKMSILGISVDSADEEPVPRSKSDNALFGRSPDCFFSDKPVKTRRQSVIEDMSVMCSDCRLLKQKCSECKLLLSGQELLKMNERRMSLMEPKHTVTVNADVKQEFSKMNGLVGEGQAQNKKTLDHVDSTCGIKSADSTDNNSHDKMLFSMSENDKQERVQVESRVTSAGQQSQSTQKDKELSGRNAHAVDNAHVTRTTGSKSTESYSEKLKEKSNSLEEKYAKIFPVERDRKYLSRREKVGYWLSSIATTQDYSIEKDDTVEGQKDMLATNGNALRGKPGSEEDMEITQSSLDDRSVGRPLTLSLCNNVGSQGRLRSSCTSMGSDWSTGTAKQSVTTMPDVTVNKHDPGTQYRLDFTNLHVTDADSEMSPPAPVDQPLSNSDDDVTMDTSCKPQTKHNAPDRKREEQEVRISERQRMFEFLKTPSLATRHMSLGLKIIEDDMDWTELCGGNFRTPSPSSSTEQRFADFLRTPSISSKPSSLWSSYENISTPSNNEPVETKLILPPFSSRGVLSHSASSASIGSDNDLIYNVDLSLEAKVKISDKPVKCLLATSCNNEPIILSFSGSHGDDEAVLKWRKHQNEDLWTNEPVMEICPKTKQTILPTYMRRRISSQSSFSSIGSMDSNTRQKH